MRDFWQWWLTQILAVPWGRVGDLPGSKVLLLLASTSIVAYFLFRALRELYAAGEKAFAAFLTLVRVFARTVPPILFAGLAAAAGSLGGEPRTIVSLENVSLVRVLHVVGDRFFFDLCQSLRLRQHYEIRARRWGPSSPERCSPKNRSRRSAP